MRFTDKPCVAGGRVVHALQGGGPGLRGRFIENKTWCGVERRALVMLVPTDREPTCKTSLRALAAHKRMVNARQKREKDGGGP